MSDGCSNFTTAVGDTLSGPASQKIGETWDACFSLRQPSTSVRLRLTGTRRGGWGTQDRKQEELIVMFERKAEVISDGRAEVVKATGPVLVSAHMVHNVKNKSETLLKYVCHRDRRPLRQVKPFCFRAAG